MTRVEIDRSETPTERVCRWAARAWLAGVLLLGIGTFRDYGVTTDEPIRAYTGENWLRWMATGDPDLLPVQRLRYYGAIFDMAGVAATRIDIALTGTTDTYRAKHLLAFLAMWAGLLGVYSLAGRLGPQPLPLLALLFMTTMPRWYGSFNNPKDVPFATTTVWAAVALLIWLDRPNWRTTLAFAFAAGLCTAIRPYGVLWIPVGAAFAGCWSLLAGRRQSEASVASPTSSPTATSTEQFPTSDLQPGLACDQHPSARVAPSRRHIVGFVIAGLAFTYLLWPTLWVTPPTHLWDSLVYLTKFPDGGASLYFGKIIERDGFLTERVPIELAGVDLGECSAHLTYMPVWTAITVPEGTLTLLAVGLLAWLLRIGRIGLTEPNSLRWLLIVAWLVLPWVAASIKGVNYGRTSRHFFFLLPAIALLAAWGTVALAELLRRLTGGRAALSWLPGVAWLLAGLVVADSAFTMVRLHPYQSLYFSRIIGGLPGAVGRFDVENWGQSLHEGFDWVAANAVRRPARIHAGLGPDPLGGEDNNGFHARRLGLIHNPVDPDYFISIVMQNRENRFPGRVVHAVERDGVPLTVVVRLDPWEPITAMTVHTASGPRTLSAANGQFELAAVGVRVPPLTDYAAEDTAGTPVTVSWTLSNPNSAPLKVPLLLGFKGPGTLTVGKLIKPIGDRLRNQPHNAFAGMHRVDLTLPPGETRCRLTAELRHDTNLYLHRVVPPPAEGRMALP